MRNTLLSLMLSTLAVACSGGPNASSAPQPASTAPQPSSSAPNTPGEPPPATADACPRLAGGPLGSGVPMVDFARAVHAHRFWGPGPDSSPSEAAIANALSTSSSITEATLVAFAKGLDGACAQHADSRPLGQASASLTGSVVVVRPGVGDLTIPTGAASAAIDLRDLPQSSDLMPALERAFAAVSHAGVSLADEDLRACNGEPDEVFSVGAGLQNAYSCEERKVPGRALAATGPLDLPLAILTGPTLAPDAARFAVSLRARGRAWLIGEDIPTALAESKWYGVGDAGLAVRTRSLSISGQKVPDVVSADKRSADPVAAWAGNPRQDAPPALSGDAKRADFAPRPIPTTFRSPTNGPGDGRAALVLAYATVRAFWPYVEELSAPIDGRLTEAMTQLDADIGSGRPAVAHALGRMSEALSDGHSYVSDFADRGSASYAPIAVVPLGSDIVVAVSATPLVSPGEAILAVDGKPIADVLAGIESVTSCSPHEKAAFASNYVFHDASPTVHVRGLDGVERDVALTGVSTPPVAFGMWDRAPGPLTDLDAPDVFYVSLNAYGKYPPHTDDMTAIDKGLAAARAVVLDMRGYPELASWDILGRVIPNSTTGPAIAMLDATADTTVAVPTPPEVLTDFTNSQTSFTGPVVLLVGHGTQSQAEHLTSFFRNSKRGKVVGVQTSGANGNITGIQLPGGWGMTFTGMHVAHADGSRFFGIGHIPDVVVEPTPPDLHDHRDAVLLKAIDVLAAH